MIWLAPRAGKMNQIARCDWLPERARWSHLARSALPAVKIGGYWSSSIFGKFMYIDFVSVHKQAKKELGQYPAILTSHLVNNLHIHILYLNTITWESSTCGVVKFGGVKYDEDLYQKCLICSRIVLNQLNELHNTNLTYMLMVRYMHDPAKIQKHVSLSLYVASFHVFELKIAG